VYCPRCGSIQPDSARFCERCGEDLRPDEPLKPEFDPRWLVGLCAVVLAGLIVGILLVSGVFDSDPVRKPVRAQAPTPVLEETVTTEPEPTQAPTEAPTEASTVQPTRATVARTCGRNGQGGDCRLSVREQPSSDADELQRLSEGDPLELICQVRGTRVRSSALGGSSDVWSQTADGGYVSNAYVQGEGLSPTRITLERC